MTDQIQGRGAKKIGDELGDRRLAWTLADNENHRGVGRDDGARNLDPPGVAGDKGEQLSRLGGGNPADDRAGDVAASGRRVHSL